LKGNAVKDQHRNEIKPTICLFRQCRWEVPSAFAVLKVNFTLVLAEVAAAKSLLSRNRHQRRDAYQSQQGMMKNKLRKSNAEKVKNQKQIF
jgi:hypothetical protein